MNVKKELYFQVLNASVLFVFAGILFLNYAVYSDNKYLDYWVLLLETPFMVLLYGFWFFSGIVLIVLFTFKNFRSVLLPILISLFALSFIFTGIIKIIQLILSHTTSGVV